MNWSKVKSVMIVFLILVNLSLLSYIVYEEVRVNKQNSQMAQTTASLLKSRHIIVDEKMIADCSKSEKVQSVYVDNIISNYFEFAKKVLGDSSAQISQNRYQSKLGTIDFMGDIFKAKATDNKYLYEKNITTQDAEKIITQYLNSLGINTEKTRVKLTEENGMYELVYTKKINSLPVFQTYITIKADNSGINSIYGNWYNINSQNSSVIELKSISGVLVEYMNKKSDLNTDIQINGISLGYSALNPDVYHESVFLTPVWKISDSTGDYYIDARENS